MRKKIIWFLLVAVLLITVSAGVTAALLVSSSKPVINTFTMGGVDITLTETTGDKYIMTPGVTVAKDPVVTVIANSESSWLFIKVDKKNDFDTFCTYKVRNSWTALDGYEDIYYQMVEESATNQVFPIIKNNSIVIKESLTEEQLNAVTENPTLKFKAYAIQSDGLATAEDAWKALNQGKE